MSTTSESTDVLLAQWELAAAQADELAGKLKAKGILVPLQRSPPAVPSHRCIGSEFGMPADDARLQYDLRAIVGEEPGQVLSPDRARAVLRVFAETIEAGSVPDKAVLRYLAQSFRRFESSPRRKDPGQSIARALGLARQKAGRPKSSKGADLTPDQRIAIAFDVVREREAIAAKRKDGEATGVGTPHELAVEQVAKAYGISDGAVRTCLASWNRNRAALREALAFHTGLDGAELDALVEKLAE